MEVGCGTGRISLRLAQEGISVVGLDFSPAMLEVARKKSYGISNVRWVVGDMQAFNLGKCFDLILIPGHSFQFMLTPTEQEACLTCISRHLTTSGKLVIHINNDDPVWLASLVQGQPTDFNLAGEYYFETDNEYVRKWTAWGYEPSTRIASAITVWEVLGDDYVVKERRESDKKDLHCFSHSEMEQLLVSTNFQLDKLYGDFNKQEFKEMNSENMIWVVKKAIANN